MNTYPHSSQTHGRRLPGRTTAIATCLLVVTLLLPGGAGWTVQAAPPAQEAPPSRLPYDGPFALPQLEGAAPRIEAAPALTAPEYVNWSKLVFQSARNENDWEIYSARGDGSNQANISNHGSTDIHPRLNRGATRVVFASNRHGGYDIFTMNADGGGQTRIVDSAGDDVFPAWSPDGSRIAFQAYRDGQPEIYVANADGSGQTRLTNHGDYDGQPAWSPDGSQIAFARRAAGQYLVWAMNADGSNQRPLSNQAYSADPAWSPDGSQIAYDCDGDGDGWQEIWLMDADGSNQRQVYDPPEGNTDAWVGSWSPDGRYVAFTRISFVYNQGQWYWTTAYLDAWDSTQPWSTVRLSSNGADWNPDWAGTDAIAPTSSVQPLPAQSPGPFTVRWSGADEGGSGVRSYDVQVKEGASGVWANWQTSSTATSASFSGTGGRTYYFRSRARDYAGNVEAWPNSHDAMTTVESMPPVSSIRPLPEFMHRDGAVMTVNGYDVGGSQIDRIELECRDGTTGPWLGCGTISGPGSVPVPGVLGRRIYIRSRAIDSAGNVESWPPGDGDTYTNFYLLRVSGLVRDNGGAPLVGATVNTTPASFATVANEPDGRYSAYIAESTGDGFVEVILEKTGYGSIPSTQVKADSIASWYHMSLNAHLPPADNLVRNSGFEQPLEGSWQAGGRETPITPALARYTGGQGAVLGWPFTPTANLSNQPGYSRLHDVTGDHEGGLHVTWENSDSYGNPTEILYRHRTAEGTWDDPVVITSQRFGTGSRLVADPTGAVYAVWEAQGTIYMRKRLLNGQWSPSETVGGALAHLRWVGLDGNGSLHVIWSEGATSEVFQIYHAQRSGGGVWSPATQVSNSTYYGAHNPSPAITTSGALTVAWTQQIPNQGSTVFIAQRDVGGTWSTPQQLFVGDKQRLLAGPGNALHLVWTWGNEMRYSGHQASGPWSSPEVIMVGQSGYAILGDAVIDQQGRIHLAVSGDCASNGCEIKYLRRSDGMWMPPEWIALTPSGAGDFRLAINADGTVFAAWRHWVSSYWYFHELCFSRRSSSGVWSPYVTLTERTYHHVDTLDLVVDGLGRAHVVWRKENEGGSDVFHALYIGTPPESDSWLSQTLTIPATMTNPGLSFLYQFRQGNQDGLSPFSVVVQEGANATTLLSTTTINANWTHRWFNLNPWKGKTVTITFRLVNASEGSPVVVYLDDVAVGSTYPDLWISNAGTSAVPSDPVIYTITYGNRGAVAATDARVSVALPAGMVFVGATPPPSNTGSQLIWDVGNLTGTSGPLTITVTARADPPVGLGTVTSTASITSQSTELETHNNSAQATVFVGHIRYLPVIMR